MSNNSTNKFSVGELAAPTRNSLVGGPFGSNLGTADYVPTGVPVIRGQNLNGGTYVGGDFVFVSEEKADSLRANLAYPGDLVFTQRGNAVLQGGQVAIVPERPWDRYLVSQSQMKLTPDRDKVDPRFLYFTFTSAAYREYLSSNAVVTGVPHINLGLLRDFRIELPPLTVQRVIAHILGTLDDKIELNRRMNATLESMARAMFQSWFVDFDPVRAKMDGRKPVELDGKTASLFSSSFKETTLGPIPSGWSIRTVESLCDTVTSGGTPARMNKEFWEPGTIDWFKTGELLDGPLLESGERISEIGLGNSSCRLWPAGTILFALYASPTVGRLGVLTRPGTANQAAAALIVKPAYGVAFLMQTLVSARAELQRIAVGAAQQNINQGVLKKHLVVAPPPALALLYSQRVTPFFEQRINAQKESCTLAALRDTLLPKLLSGEISVAEAESLT